MTKLCLCGEESKYRCPKCEQRTCSLVCVKKHKLESDCDGIVEKTKFVKLSDFDNMKLISDFKFLENIKEFMDNSHRQLLNQANSGEWLVKKRCIDNDTLLKLMPDTFTRSKTNKSCFKEDNIHWSVELIFSDSATKILAHDISESTTVADVIESYKLISANYAEYRFVSGYYKDEPKVSYFVQAERFGANIFHKIDPAMPIKEMLKFKTVIEYPTIYITKRPAEFQVIDCSPFDVKEEMRKLGIFQENKRKRNNRRRAWKKKGNGKDESEANKTKDKEVEDSAAEPNAKRDVISNHSNENKVPQSKPNSFRDQCMQFFDTPAGPPEAEDGEVSD